MSNDTHCEIQVRQKGAWRCWIGFKPNAPGGAVNASWGHMASARHAARLVHIRNGRVYVIAAKKRGTI